MGRRRGVLPIPEPVHAGPTINVAGYWCPPILPLRARSRAPDVLTTGVNDVDSGAHLARPGPSSTLADGWLAVP